MQKNCETCKYCWKDESVDYRECLMIDKMTEEEAIKYDENMNDGCPFYKTEEYEENYYL